MTVSELRKLYQQQILQEAEILHDVAIPGWLIEFRGKDGALYELTDILGCPVSFRHGRAGPRTSASGGRLPGSGGAPLPILRTLAPPTAQ